MKLLSFLLIAFLVSCVITLKHKEQELKNDKKDLTEKLTLKTDSLEEIRESNREYIDIALNCNANHK